MNGKLATVQNLRQTPFTQTSITVKMHFCILQNPWHICPQLTNFTECF